MDSNIIVALIGATATVAAALITAYAQLHRRRRRPKPTGPACPGSTVSGQKKEAQDGTPAGRLGIDDNGTP
jgi:hypothetical protein